MKTKLINFGQNCWQMLTEVPGWPDAPKKIRLRRALPILIPCGAILLLLGWNKLVRDPHIQGERGSRQALLAQDKEIEDLLLAVSDQQAGELSTRAAAVEKEILNDPKELAPILQDLKRRSAELHWEGNFQASDLSTGASPVAGAPDSQITFAPARAKLVSTPGDSAAFTSLIALLDQVSATEKRIDLTRLAIRADEQGRYTAELNLRLVARSPNEKTPQ